MQLKKKMNKVANIVRMMLLSQNHFSREISEALMLIE